MADSIPFLYQGLLASTASWARVGRGYLEGLSAIGFPIAAVKTRGYRYDETFSLPASWHWYTPAEALARDVACGFGFLHPPLLDRLIGDRRLNAFVWEASRVPSEWIRAFQRASDVTVVVPSAATRTALVESGLSDSQIAVVTYGYSPELVARAATLREAAQAAESPTSEVRTFLTVAAPHWRKGLGELLRAYRRAFRRDDPVRLLIKTAYDPAKNRRRQPFEIPGWEALWAECGGSDPDAPSIAWSVEESDDLGLAEWLGAADVYVGVSWGESFGLALLEAAACGLPVISTGWGGQTDFLPSDDDRIGFELCEDARGIYTPAPGAKVAIPDVDALAARLRWHADRPDLSRRRGQALATHVQNLTWTHAARELTRLFR